MLNFSLFLSFIVLISACKTSEPLERLSETVEQYPLCQPQSSLSPKPESTPEVQNKSVIAGKVFDRSQQKAPSFFEDMAACHASSVDKIEEKRLELAALESGGPEMITEKFDEHHNCLWTDPKQQDKKLMQCHFHSAPEFMSNKSQKRIFGENLAAAGDDLKSGELYWIFYAPDNGQPTVYGMHVSCRKGTDVLTEKTKICHSDILRMFGDCDARNFSCCDRGTLTLQMNDTTFDASVQPNFRKSGGLEGA